MKTRVFAAAVIGLGMVVGASAAQEKPAPTQEGSMDPKSVTVTGCVAQGATASTYTLTNIKPEAGAAQTDAPKPKVLALEGTDVDLRGHVGHEVAVTGVHVVPSAVGTTGTAGSERPAPAAAPQAAAKDDDEKPTAAFTVKSLKMVASTCTPPAAK